MNLQSSTTWANWIIKPERLAEIKHLKQEILIKRVKKALRVRYKIHEEEKKLELIYEEKAKVAHEKGDRILRKDIWIQNKLEKSCGSLLKTERKDDKIRVGKYEIKNSTDESLLLGFCIEKIEEALGRLNYPSGVLSAAITYFKRFYLRHSMYEYDPIQMMFVVLFFAIKLEEYNINIAEFCSKVQGCSEQVIIKYEYVLLRALKYDLTVFSPFRAIKSLLLKLAPSNQEAFIKLANQYLIRCFKSDAIYLYSPSILALACAKNALKKKLDQTTVDQLIASNVLKHLPHPQNVLLSVEDAIGLIAKVPKKVDQTYIQNIRLALKSFHKTVPQFLRAVDDRDAEFRLHPETGEEESDTHLKVVKRTSLQQEETNDRDGFAIPHAKRKKLQ